MLKLATLLLVLGTASYLNASTPFNDLIINTEGGQVRGQEERTSLFGDRYFSWKGIPYAEPPVGMRRFADPVPHRPWSGVRDARRHGDSCAIAGIIRTQIGSEDCLFLNVYTQSIIGRRPVMVWIHGGAFQMGSGDDFMYGPDFFVTEDVVYVTLNYRLGILGFLSTGDRHAPGNYGMKDMVLALKWVKNNIVNFGGDPDNITIFGESAGSVSVHCEYLKMISFSFWKKLTNSHLNLPLVLTLSPMVTYGLFHKAILQSGTGLSSWTMNLNPAQNAYDLANQLGVSYLNNEDLVAKLRQLPGRQLMDTTPGLLDMDIARGLVSAFSYAPVIDAADYTGDKFLPRHPREIMESGGAMDIPMIIGYCSEESLFMAREQILDGDVRDTVNQNRHLVVPTTLWDIDPRSPNGQAMTNDIWSFYMNNEPLRLGNRLEWSRWNTDVHFLYGIDQSVRLHLQHKFSPIYYYRFSFDGSLNFLKRLTLLTSFPGAMHADDLGYLFNIPNLPMLPSNQALVVRRRMARMWTDFAKYSNPTPVTDSLITTTWPRVGNNMEFMDIGDNMIPGTYPNGERLRFMETLKQRYVN